MKLWRRAVLGLLLLTISARSVVAVPIFGDPTTIALLNAVAQVLQVMNEFELALQDVIQRKIDVIVGYNAFPKTLRRQIDQTLAAVRGLRDEAAQMSCDWALSPRIEALRSTHLDRLRLCKPEFQLVWGDNEGHWDADRQEIQDYAGTMSANLLSDRTQAETTWQAVFPSMEQVSGRLRRSPGESNRDEAVALAGAAVVADSNSAMATQALMVAQLEREEERAQERQALTLGEFIRSAAAGEDPWRAPSGR